MVTCSREIDEVFKGIPNIFNRVDNTLLVEYDYDGADYGRMIQELLKIFRKENLKQNEDMIISDDPAYHFW